jgi:hypothetical protein
MTEANFPVSGLPLIEIILPPVARGRHLPPVSGTYLFTNSTTYSASRLLEVGDERHEADAIQGGGFAEEPGLLIGLFERRLAEFLAQQGKASKHEGEGLFAGEHGQGA